MVAWVGSRNCTCYHSTSGQCAVGSDAKNLRRGKQYTLLAQATRAYHRRHEGMRSTRDEAGKVSCTTGERVPMIWFVYRPFLMKGFKATVWYLIASVTKRHSYELP